jgi:hypothetical protein
VTAEQTPASGQRQDSLNNQLNDLHRLAVEHGMYDAADWMRSMRGRRTGSADMGHCPRCSRRFRVRNDGLLYDHWPWGPQREADEVE